MTTKRNEFLSRLLRISQLNQQLIELNDKSFRQPAFAKKIKLIQMNPSSINIQQTHSLRNHSQKNTSKIMIINRRNQSKQIINTQQTNTIDLYQKQVNRGQCIVSSNLLEVSTKRHSLRDCYEYNSSQCMSTSVHRPEEIFRRKIQYRANQNADFRYRKGELSEKLFEPEKSYNPESIIVISPSKFRDQQSIIQKKVPRLSQNKLQFGSKYSKSIPNNSKTSIHKRLQQQKKAKLSLLKQISKNYTRPFVPPPKITSKSYIICEIKQNEPSYFRVVNSFNSKTSQQVASLTKIMTCIIVIEFCTHNLIPMQEQQVKIGKYEDSIGGTSANLQRGQIYTVIQLLYGLMLPSGNDASLALAVWCGKKLLLSERIQRNIQQNCLGSYDGKQKLLKSSCYSRFIKEMNIRAQQIQMKKTIYANSHGLTNAANRSTAFDISLLCAYAMKNPIFRQIVSCIHYKCKIKHQNQLQAETPQKDACSNTEPDEIQKIQQGTTTVTQISSVGRPLTANPSRPQSALKQRQQLTAKTTITELQIQWQNTHRLLHSKPHEYIGIKTGITTSAGPCLSSCLSLSGRLFLVVVLNCARVGLRFKETEILKNWLMKHEGISKSAIKGGSLKMGQSAMVLGNEGSQEEEQEDEGND